MHPSTSYFLCFHYFGLTVAHSRFSTSYTTHGFLFLSFCAPLNPFTSLRPICLSHGPVIYYSCRLDLMGFLSICQISFLSVLLGFSFPLGLPKWPSTKIYIYIYIFFFYIININSIKLYSSPFHGYIDLELNFLVIFFSTYIVKQILKNSSTLSSKASPLHTKSYFFYFIHLFFTKHHFIYSTHLCNKNLFFYNFLLFSPSLPSLPH